MQRTDVSTTRVPIPCEVQLDLASLAHLDQQEEWAGAACAARLYVALIEGSLRKER